MPSSLIAAHARGLVLCTSLVLAGCSTFGSDRLTHDQVDYSRAVDLAQKRQTLANIVGLRYADSASFLPVTQIIAAYQFDRSINATLQGGTSSIDSAINGGGSVLYGNHPTFTFTPVKGEDFANGYIRPMSPALVLPLAQSGVPIDLLFRIVVQSIGDLQNSAALSGADSSGNLGFFELIHALRRLQLKGALTVRYEAGDKGGHVYMAIDPTRSTDDEVMRDARTVHRLLRLGDSFKEFEIVYGAVPSRGAAVSVVTRSVIGILTELGAQIEVPEADVASKATVPTVQLLKAETRPTIVVHVGDKPPKTTYAQVEYNRSFYWIDPLDFDSKFAFSVVQNLIALAESSLNSKAPIVTIPAS